MILKWAIAALIALSVVACGVKTNLEVPSGMQVGQEAARSFAAAATSRSVSR